MKKATNFECTILLLHLLLLWVFRAVRQETYKNYKVGRVINLKSCRVPNHYYCLTHWAGYVQDWILLMTIAELGCKEAGFSIAGAHTKTWMRRSRIYCECSSYVLWIYKNITNFEWIKLLHLLLLWGFRAVRHKTYKNYQVGKVITLKSCSVSKDFAELLPC